MARWMKSWGCVTATDANLARSFGRDIVLGRAFAFIGKQAFRQQGLSWVQRLLGGPAAACGRGHAADNPCMRKTPPFPAAAPALPLALPTLPVTPGDAPPAGLFRAEADGRWRCAWCQASAEYRRYHDEEWGFPVSDDRRLFEKLCLEGFQSGLSWLTILNKRENFRRAFDGFDAARVADYTAADVARLLADAGIVRHRGKIESTINNAHRVLALRAEFGSLAAYAWRHEPAPSSRPERPDWSTLRAMSTSAASVAMSKDLKKRGWSFVGPTTVYAFMQAMGLVNDHIEGCATRGKALAARAAFKRP